MGASGLFAGRPGSPGVVAICTVSIIWVDLVPLLCLGFLAFLGRTATALLFVHIFGRFDARITKHVDGVCNLLKDRLLRERLIRSSSDGRAAGVSRR